MRILFQSTRPVWGATPRRAKLWPRPKSFNPRAPCGARPGWLSAFGTRLSFNPRAPCGARRKLARIKATALLVSIHAPRVGRDEQPAVVMVPKSSFNPRAPCGARPGSAPSRPIGFCFNPRAPCGARHENSAGLHAFMQVSIHAPRVGRDGACRIDCAERRCFNPRAPCGARRVPE